MNLGARRLLRNVACVVGSAPLLLACAGRLGFTRCLLQSAPAVHREVAKALGEYQQLLRAQDSAGIAELFVPGGRLQHIGQDPIVGRKQIQAFMNSFANYKILSHDMAVTSSSDTACHASQSGTYVQDVRAPDGQEIMAHGWFLFQWEKQADGQWLIVSGQTSSAPIPDAGH